jgi:hypothetical protein
MPQRKRTANLALEKASNSEALASRESPTGSKEMNPDFGMITPPNELPYQEMSSKIIARGRSSSSKRRIDD